jgi:ABC-type antimicrobial peptide transport system permease subunit
MAEHLEHDPTLPPPAEVIHMPESSYLPFVLALGITISLVGILTGVIVSIIGVIIVLVVLARWIRSARADMAELPLDHSSH